MHKNAIALSSDHQATFLRAEKSFLATRAARLGFAPVPHLNGAPGDSDWLESNQNYAPNESCPRRRTVDERNEQVCNNDGNHHQVKLYEIRKFVSEINEGNNEENKCDDRARRLVKATSGLDQDQREKQQNHQLFALTRFTTPFKMEFISQQEQVASSKQQQQAQRAQHESMVELLDTTSQTNTGRTSISKTTTTPTATPTTTTTAKQEDMISPIQNETHSSVLDQKTISSFCAGCQAQIKDKFIFSVIDLYWHQDCVQCADCSLKLNDRCYTLNGKLYCKHDYWHRFGPKCFACQQSIEQSELVQRIKGNRVYHLKCFTCHECQRPLKQGEQLHLVGDKRLLCKQDFQKLNDYRLLSSGDDGGNGGSNTDGQSKQDPTSNNNGSSSGSSSYLTLLGGGNSIKNSSPEAAGGNTNGNGQQVNGQQKRSSLTSLDNMALEDTTELACQRARINGELQDQEADERAEVDDDDEDDQLGESRGNRRGSSICLDTAMPIDDDDEQDQFNEDEENLVGRQRHSIISSGGDSERRADELQANCSAKPIINKQQQKHSINPLANGAGARKKRRRKQRLSMVNNDKQQTAGKQQLSQTKPDTKLMRNGESILNGLATSSTQQQQPASILAGMHSMLDGSVTSNKQQHKSSCSSSSSSSSSSNHSSSNSSTVTNSHHHDHHHQQGSGAAHRLGPSVGSVHHHHHSSGGNHQPQQSTGGGGHKPTRVRTVLNEKQLQTLRDCYAQNPRPDALMKEQLVDMTGLSPRVIRVWFQNKRCKDKKKSILYKQMQQHEKDGRHLTGLTHIRGVPMVAASPIHYQDDHSMGATTTPMSAAAGAVSADPSSPQSQQQQQQHQRQPATVQSPPQSNQPIDIHAYQPPWKGLVEYAQQAGPGTPQQPDRLNASSPRYVQLIGQIHGYGSSTATTCDHQVGGELNSAQQQQQQQFGGSQAPANAYPQAPPLPQQQQQQQPPPPHHIQLQHQQQQQLHHQLHQQQQQQQQQHQHHHSHHHQNNHHLHHNHHHLHHQPQQQAHLAQVVSPMAGHHAGQFQH